MRVAVVIPCFKVKSLVLPVLAAIGDEVEAIYAIDDCCPEGSGAFIEENCADPRLTVHRHEKNKGVGGAIMTGYGLALGDGMDIIVKVDGDGQMDPALISELIRHIVNLDADYVKGNRFYSLYDVHSMPPVRLFGNAVLSFMTKISSGYWRIFDPTNGFTAISAIAAKRLNFENISERYFFETDMLINLGGIRAVVHDFPMQAVYADEESNLKVRDIAVSFLIKHVKASVRRIFYTYFLRDFSVASVNLFFSILFGLFGMIFGAIEWSHSIQTGIPASTGTVMIAVLPIILSVQFFIAFLSHDIGNEPTVPLIRSKYDRVLLPKASERLKAPERTG
ncbi:glycosyltransferase family 2 protein [Pelagibius sp. Alg239-R121]|uniref:glycosyltransferase family 2 protein n=1 Tax=Pelagibius sp. Alg239-R121 TaxID=2993448 RepID=UPI0024A729D4|nr:glycosyltransferase family 2 protein [Pelagibius sp. Alg239-R121]